MPAHVTYYCLLYLLTIYVIYSIAMLNSSLLSFLSKGAKVVGAPTDALRCVHALGKSCVDRHGAIKAFPAALLDAVGGSFSDVAAAAPSKWPQHAC